MKKYIIVNGAMGTGKTSVGRRVAELLGRADENLSWAIELLNEFNKRTDCVFIDTSDLSVDAVAEKIIGHL
jgi:cytidylate kinase